jgi:Flp pilus assembly protein TadG
MISKLLAGVCRLIPDRRGVAAVEFALVAPLLLSMYFVTMEVAQGIEANKKVGRVGSMVADLITQQSEITPDQLEAIMKIGQSILQPYNRSTPKIVVTAIEITPDPGSRVQVAWSGKIENGGNGAPGAEHSEHIPRPRRKLSELQAAHHLVGRGQADARPHGRLRQYPDEGDVLPAAAHEFHDRM